MTHPNNDNQAERAAFEAAYAAQYPTTLNIARYKLERDEQGDYEDGAVFVAWEMWQAARAAPPALDAEGLPEPTCFGMDHILGKAVYGYTAEQVQAMIELDRTQFARQDQKPARASVDTYEFRKLLGTYVSAIEGQETRRHIENVRAALIAHINAWGGVEQREGK